MCPKDIPVNKTSMHIWDSPSDSRMSKPPEVTWNWKYWLAAHGIQW